MPPTDGWVYVPEFAAALGITRDVLRRYRQLGHVPPGERDPVNGRWRWPRDVAQKHVADVSTRRARGLTGPHGVAFRTHEHIAVAVAGDLPDVEIAKLIGVSRRTVYRHRTGRCHCDE